MKMAIRPLTKHLMHCVLVFVAVSPIAAQTPITEQEVIQRLDQIRAIRVTSDSALLSEYNGQLDETWTFFKNSKKEVLPILASQLRIEREKAEPNDFLMLDIGYFIYLEGDEDSLYKEEAREALYSLNPDDEVVAASQEQLFHFVHKVAADKDPRILGLIDRAFLYNRDRQIFIPQHAMSLDSTLICVFLYGIYGQGSEEHLIQLLDDPEVSNQVIELLTWIGTDKSVDGVKKAMMTQRDYATFTRALAYMMQMGGLAGQEIMLEIDVQDFDSESQQYYAQVKEAINGMSYELLKSTFAGLPGEVELPNDDLKTRLSEMYENYGKDEETNPIAILNSGLPNEFLIGKLRDIRSRMFYRISDEGLSDVQVTNFLINTLQYQAD